MDRWFAFFHLFTAMSFVGTLVLSDWCGRAARATTDWGQRASLFEVIARATRVSGLPSLILAGVLGNLVLMSRGYKMADDSWPRWINGLWLAEVLVFGLVSLPAAGRLAAMARSAAAAPAADWDSTLRRWRLGNAVAGVLYLALLALMVFRWRG